MNEVVITSAVRTPIGKLKGSLKNISAVELGTLVIKEALKLSQLDPNQVSQVIFGQGLQAGCGQNPARQASINAGLPYQVPAITINQVCGSGLRSIAMGYEAIRSGGDGVVVCGGQENMTRAPHCAYVREGMFLGDVKFVDSMMEDGLTDAFAGCKMGVTAENIAQKFNISREKQDEYSLRSHMKAAEASKKGKFRQEIIPVPLNPNKQTGCDEMCEDEHVRKDLTIEKLIKLKPCFVEGRESEGGECSVTAGNSCGINDGAAALVLMSRQQAVDNKVEVLGRIVSWSQAGVDPQYMGLGPVPAVQQALLKAGWKIEDVDLFEINEAFASQTIACLDQLGIDYDKANVNGGSIGLGHPIGASGARIMVTLLHEMKRRRNCKKGVAAICVGGGMGVAMCVETVQ